MADEREENIYQEVEEVEQAVEKNGQAIAEVRSALAEFSANWTIDRANIFKALETLGNVLTQLQGEVAKIIELIQPATANDAVFIFTSKGTSMPLILPDNDQDTYSAVGVDPAGILGAPLAAGQTATVVSADPATIVIVADATALPTTEAFTDASGRKIPVGTPTIASGTVKAAIPPAAPNTPITVTLTVLNGDGTTAFTKTDTATVAPGTATSAGVLFGTPVPVTALKSKK
jgi:hypothetical protein